MAEPITTQPGVNEVIRASEKIHLEEPFLNSEPPEQEMPIVEPIGNEVIEEEKKKKRNETACCVCSDPDEDDVLDMFFICESFAGLCHHFIQCLGYTCTSCCECFGECCSGCGDCLGECSSGCCECLGECSTGCCECLGEFCSACGEGGCDCDCSD